MTIQSDMVDEACEECGGHCYNSFYPYVMKRLCLRCWHNNHILEANPDERGNQQNPARNPIKPAKE